MIPSHQVQWALEYHLPLVLHCREAFPELFEVMGAEKLIVEMIDNPGEFNAFMDKIQEFHGFKQTFQDKVEEAKN